MSEIDILNPIEIINALFGNLWLFIGVSMLGYLYISAKYRFNIQLTSLGLLAFILCGFVVQIGLISWLPFLIIFISLFGAYAFWRFIATR